MLGMLAATARQETVADSTGVKAGFVVLADLVGLLGSLPHVISDDRINISELEGRILLSDFFGGRPLGKCHDDRIEGDACFTHAYHAIGIGLQWEDIGRTQRDQMGVSTDFMLMHLAAKSKANLLPVRNTANCRWRLANPWATQTRPPPRTPHAHRGRLR